MIPDVSLLWLTPAAWWGLLGLAVPVLIHLIAKHRARRVLFPSLRFIPAAPVVALRRRVITNWPLLLVRLAILTMATCALAGPVFVSGSRRAEWNQRIARVTVSAVADEALLSDRIADEGAASFVHAHFSAAHLPDAIRDGVTWLQEQPPAAREVVVLGNLREGQLTQRDLDIVPPATGLRFVAIDDDSPRLDTRARLIADGGAGRPTEFELAVAPDLLTTAVKYLPTTGEEPRVIVDGGAALQAHADAVRRAVLREGVLLNGDRSRQVVIAFEGSTLTDGVSPPGAEWMREVLERVPDVRGSERNGALIVRAAMPLTDRRAPSIVARVAGQSFAGSFAQLEPRRLARSLLVSWSRSPGPSPDDALPADEGDRRWFWLVVLLLIGVEHLSRRNPKSSTSES